MIRLDQYLPYLQWIEGQQERMAALVEEWANINSGSENLAGLDHMREVLKNAFGPLGDTAYDIGLEPRLAVDKQGNRASVPVASALSVVKRQSARRQILLNGHMDTVFGPDSPFQRCYPLSPERLCGPGVSDLKGGLVILLIALEALERSPFAQELGWEVFLNPDEEIGSESSTPHLVQRASQCDIGIIVEPQFADGAFVSGRKGSATFALVARGRSAHAGRDFHQGINAITALLTPLQYLNEINTPDGDAILNIGTIQGGTAINIVPDLAVARFNLRASTSNTMQLVLKQIEGMVEEACLREGNAELELSLLTYRGPKPFNEATQALFHEVKRCADALEIPMTWRESGGVCDGNALASAGLPVIDSMGAAGGKIHTFDEYIELNKLQQRAKHVALVLMALATGDFRLPAKEQKNVSTSDFVN